MEFELEELLINHQVKCYYGAFDSKTERVMSKQEKALEKIRTIHPNAKTCYFPVECYYSLHTGYPDYKDIVPPQYERGQVIYDALVKLFT